MLDGGFYSDCVMIYDYHEAGSGGRRIEKYRVNSGHRGNEKSGGECVFDWICVLQGFILIVL